MLLEEIVRKYYVNLYTSEPITTCTPETWEFPSLNHQDKRWPNREVNALEIKQSLAQMDGKKAPGIDGLSAGFFHKQWDTVGPSVINFIQTAFRVGSFPAKMNKTLISLIPKQTLPECMPYF